MKNLFVLSCLLVLASARPGLWFRPDGTTAMVGLDSLTCNNLYLGAYGAGRTICGGCTCGLDRTVVARSRTTVSVKFDHTIHTITVNSVARSIPYSVDRNRCEPDRVMAFRWRCNRKILPELVYYSLPPYECVETKSTKC